MLYLGESFLGVVGTDEDVFHGVFVAEGVGTDTSVTDNHKYPEEEGVEQDLSDN